MIKFFQTRQAVRNAKDILRQANHLRNIREDMMRDADLNKLSESENALKEAIRAGDLSNIEKESETLLTCLNKIIPVGRPSALAENFEILVVAVVVAMGFRTYFIQPFKIPTGSMEPTLNGIHAEAHTNPTFMDKLPMKCLKWLAYGEWYIEVRVKEDGVLSNLAETTSDETGMYWYVGNRRYTVPRGAKPRFYSGTVLKKGEILWSGTMTTGDHVFVDKVRWNFARPKRGEVMVFSTQGIKTLPEGTHYIKRLIGLPNETVSVVPPNILINGNVVKDAEGIVRIEQQKPGYEAGYTLPYGYSCYISSTSDVKQLGPSDYFPLGDNTQNSRDGRYWGTVPARNMIGPAFLVYWPYSQRWGHIR